MHAYEIFSMFGLAFPQRGARPNATFYEKLQNGASTKTYVCCGFTVETNIQFSG